MNLNAQQELNGKYIMEYSHNAILHNMWASTLQSHAMDESRKVVFRKDAKYKILHSVWFVDRSTKQVRLIYAIRHQDGEYLGHNDREHKEDVWSPWNVLFCNQGTGYMAVLCLWKFSVT